MRHPTLPLMIGIVSTLQCTAAGPLGASMLLLVAAVACQTVEPHVVHYRWRQPTTLMIGDTVHLQAAVCRGRDARCAADTTLTIESSDTTVASVSASGTVRTRALGRAVVRLEAAGARADTVPIRVIPRVARVVIAPAQATVPRGDSAIFEVRAFDAAGKEVTDPPVWFEHWARRARWRLWSPRIVLFGERPDTLALIARVGAVEDTATFVVLRNRRPRSDR
jgi:hypothetical protein